MNLPCLHPPNSGTFFIIVWKVSLPVSLYDSLCFYIALVDRLFMFVAVAMGTVYHLSADRHAPFHVVAAGHSSCYAALFALNYPEGTVILVLSKSHLIELNYYE